MQDDFKLRLKIVGGVISCGGLAVLLVSGFFYEINHPRNEPATNQPVYACSDWVSFSDGQKAQTASAIWAIRKGSAQSDPAYVSRIDAACAQTPTASLADASLAAVG